MTPNDELAGDEIDEEMHAEWDEYHEPGQTMRPAVDVEKSPGTEIQEIPEVETSRELGGERPPVGINSPQGMDEVWDQMEALRDDMQALENVISEANEELRLLRLASVSQSIKEISPFIALSSSITLFVYGIMFGVWISIFFGGILLILTGLHYGEYN